MSAPNTRRTKIFIDVSVDRRNASRSRLGSGTHNGPSGVVVTDVFDADLIKVLNCHDCLFWICRRIMETFEQSQVCQLLLMHLFHFWFELHFRLGSIVDPVCFCIFDHVDVLRDHCLIQTHYRFRYIVQCNSVWIKKSSPYVLYFFLYLPLLHCRVSMVKGKSDSTLLSNSVCSGLFQSSSA